MDTNTTIGVYFTGAGSTKKIVHRICSRLDDAFVEFDITPHGAGVEHRFAAGDIAVFGVPSYGGRVPAPALERIASLRGNGALAVLAVSYGNRDIDDTLLELADAVEKAGFTIVAGGAFVAHHSLMTNVAQGRPDTCDLADIDRFSAHVAEKVRDAADVADLAARKPDIPGSRPYREFSGVPFQPRATSSCTGCGLCARACPTGAIPEENPAHTDSSACISCMRCVHVCRLQGRSITGFKYRIARFAFAYTVKTRQGSRVYL
ncbi:MAG: 4Fe-4S binding protein [Slackia sp.]|nr:4Fe-4S binding protein [Slackia sp.]